MTNDEVGFNPKDNILEFILDKDCDHNWMFVPWSATQHCVSFYTCLKCGSKWNITPASKEIKIMHHNSG